MEKEIKTRHHFLDLARVIAFGLLITFHAGLIYIDWPWHVKSEQRSEGIEHFLNFLTQWRIPILFFISGAGLSFVYKGEYLPFVSDRFKKILIPLFSSIAIILPLQWILERCWQGTNLKTAALHSYSFFTGNYPQGNFTFNHLWYLWDLWLISLVVVPLLFAIDNINFKANKKLKISCYLTFLLLAMVVLKALPNFVIIYYSLLFASGYLFFRHFNELKFLISKPVVFLAVGTVTYGILITYFWDEGYYSLPPKVAQWQAGKWIFRLFSEVNTLSWMGALISTLYRNFNYKLNWVGKLNSVILPIYIIHQFIITGLGYLFNNILLHPGIEFLLIQVIFWPLSFLLTYYGMARSGFFRVLFGIKNPDSKEVKPATHYSIA